MSEQPSKIGYLLINLGTPDSPEVKDVRLYLGQFLMDPHVLDVPWALRALIVNAFILPFRPKDSAEAYSKIWTPEGSPLLVKSQALADKLHQRLEAPVALSMRYGKPSIADGLQTLHENGVIDGIPVRFTRLPKSSIWVRTSGIVDTVTARWWLGWRR